MTLRKLLLVPDSQGYGDTEGDEVVATQLDGGLPRYRRDKLNASKIVSVTWTMTPSEYQYWRAFYVTATGKGAFPFLCDLVSEDGTGPAEHTCMFVPGSVQKPGQVGLTYQQSAQLNVVPIPHDPDIDEAVMAAFEASGGDVDNWYAAIDRLVTVTMPGTIGG